MVRTYHFNGIDGRTGAYLLPPQPASAVADAARNDRPDPDRQRHLASADATRATRALPYPLRPEIVADAGWGLVFHADEEADVREALRPLIEHRRREGVKADRLKMLTYQQGDTTTEWLARHETVPGVIRPWHVPLYLLVVGGPERIPFQFTQDLDAEYAVGRLYFDTAEQYARYVASVIAYERASSLPNTRDAVFFGTRHDFDAATQLSADSLVNPLANQPVEGDDRTVCARAGFTSTTFVGATATRQCLQDVLRARSSGEAAPRPSLLFTATHGVGFSGEDVLQRTSQGALLCQDWSALGQIAPEHYLSAADVSDDAELSGLVAVLFACYSAGTPRYDRFWRGETSAPAQIAPAPFFSALPQRLLAHAGGGALACIGHVERAWGNSITDIDAGPQLQAWQNLVARVLAGDPFGLALQDVNDRYAMRSVTLATMLDHEPGTAAVEDYRIAEAWLDRNDAGGFVLLGDPATHLRPAQLS